jgi:hypothetical protein
MELEKFRDREIRRNKLNISSPDLRLWNKKSRPDRGRGGL